MRQPFDVTHPAFLGLGVLNDLVPPLPPPFLPLEDL